MNMLTVDSQIQYELWTCITATETGINLVCQTYQEYYLRLTCAAKVLLELPSQSHGKHRDQHLLALGN